MKINEVNQPTQLNELALSSFIGDFGAAGLKSLFTGKGMKQQMIQDMFLKDFYEDAITSLGNGIAGNLVDPNIQANATPTVQDTEQDKATDGAPAPAAPAQTAPTSAPAAAPKPAGPTGTEQTVAAARQHRQDVGAGQRNMAAAKAAQAKPAFQRTADDKIAMKAAGLSESRFDKLNAIFESIMREADAGAQSITEYMTDWFDQYMQGVNWRARQAMVMPMIQAIETTYAKDKGKAAIKTLAKTAFALSKASPKGMPAGIKDEADKLMQQNKAGLVAPNPSSPNYNQEVAAFFQKLSTVNPQEFQRLTGEMQAIAQKHSGAVSESRKRTKK